MQYAASSEAILPKSKLGMETLMKVTMMALNHTIYATETGVVDSLPRPGFGGELEWGRTVL